MKWEVMTVAPDGRRVWTGEESNSLGQAKQMAGELAWEMTGTTFYVEGPNGRIPAVYNFSRSNA